MWIHVQHCRFSVANFSDFLFTFSVENSPLSTRSVENLWGRIHGPIPIGEVADRWRGPCLLSEIPERISLAPGPYSTACRGSRVFESFDIPVSPHWLVRRKSE